MIAANQTSMKLERQMVNFHLYKLTPLKRRQTYVMWIINNILHMKSQWNFSWTVGVTQISQALAHPWRRLLLIRTELAPLHQDAWESDHYSEEAQWPHLIGSLGTMQRDLLAWNYKILGQHPEKQAWFNSMWNTEIYINTVIWEKMRID